MKRVASIIFILIAIGFVSNAWAEKQIKYYNAMDTGTLDNSSDYILYFHTVVWNKDGSFHKDQGIKSLMPKASPITLWESQVHDKTITVAISHTQADVAPYILYASNVTVVELRKIDNGDNGHDEKISTVAQQGDYGVIVTCPEDHDVFFYYVYPGRDIDRKVTFRWDDIRHTQQYVMAYTNSLMKILGKQFSVDQLEPTIIKNTSDPEINSYDIKIDYQDVVPECSADNNYCADPADASNVEEICENFNV